MPFPSAYKGAGEFKAIVLGADPTHIVQGDPQLLEMVFGLHLDRTPYWNTIGNNLKQLDGVALENLYVQNVCRNYFQHETSKNKNWEKIAREYWIEHLKEELDELFDPEVPVLMTTQFILYAVLNEKKIESRQKIFIQICALSQKIRTFYPGS